MNKFEDLMTRVTLKKGESGRRGKTFYIDSPFEKVFHAKDFIKCNENQAEALLNIAIPNAIKEGYTLAYAI